MITRMTVCTWHVIAITRLAARVKNTAGSIRVTIAVNWRPVEGDCPLTHPRCDAATYAIFLWLAVILLAYACTFPLVQGITSYIPTRGFKVVSEDNPAS